MNPPPVPGSKCKVLHWLPIDVGGFGRIDIGEEALRVGGWVNADHLRGLDGAGPGSDEEGLGGGLEAPIHPGFGSREIVQLATLGGKGEDSFEALLFRRDVDRLAIG